MENELSRIGNEETCPAAIFIRDGKVLMGLRNYTPDKWKTISLWTVPGGRCDRGETVETTLRREIKEEIGVEDFEFVKYLGEVMGAKEGDIVPLFLCRTEQEVKLIEPEKFSQWRWFGIGELPENFISPSALKIIQKELENYLV